LSFIVFVESNCVQILDVLHVESSAKKFQVADIRLASFHVMRRTQEAALMLFAHP
jgi:hypothetical protein